MEEILRETVSVVSWGMICGYFIKDAIYAFKKEEYFRFGMELAFAVYYIAFIVRSVFV